MNYKTELRKFITGQYVYAGVRVTLACVIPALVLAYFGLLKAFFIFPFATILVGLTDLPGAFIRRRNSFIFAIICFSVVALVSGAVRDEPILVALVIGFFGIMLTMIGVYGQRLASVGGYALVIMAVFIDPHLAGNSLPKSVLILFAGTAWYLLVFMLLAKIQPYKLASQMIGENYLELADYLRLKANFYVKNTDFNKNNAKIIAKQIAIKNLQEETRETVLFTRTFINESTTTSRLLMMMFLNSFDLHEKLMTSENNYEKIKEQFGNTGFLPKIGGYLSIIANEISHIGIALQSGTKAKPQHHLNEKYDSLYLAFLQTKDIHKNVENFIILEQILNRIKELTDEIQNIYKIFSQDENLAKSLSTGLDYQQFISQPQSFNFKVLKNNLTLDSQLFRHSIRLTLALLLGYGISLIQGLEIGHSYWILITIVGILRPSYSITKSRNMLRLYGTILGGITAYILIYFVQDAELLLGILLASMVLCFTFLRGKYMTAVFFMTIYVFLTFNFINPGKVNLIFKDRILDTLLGVGISFLVSYLILPVWEHTQNLDLMKKSALANQKYFKEIFKLFNHHNINDLEYKLARKEAIVSLANLSDNFQRMISDPKNQQKSLEIIHQFVATSHLATAYMASLSQIAKKQAFSDDEYWVIWQEKINAEFEHIFFIFENKTMTFNTINELKISVSMKDKSLQNLLELIYNTIKEQRKIVEHYVSERDPKVA